jgi:hypothetical protein
MRVGGSMSPKPLPAWFSFRFHRRQVTWVGQEGDISVIRNKLHLRFSIDSHEGSSRLVHGYGSCIAREEVYRCPSFVKRI